MAPDGPKRSVTNGSFGVGYWHERDALPRHCMKQVNEHRYTAAERRRHLERLASFLPDLIKVCASQPDLVHLVSEYRSALEQAQELLVNGFTQEQLSRLGRSVPDAFQRHKDWMPPLEQNGNGSWREPEWFAVLEKRLQPTLRAAKTLCELGYY